MGVRRLASVLALVALVVASGCRDVAGSPSVVVVAVSPDEVTLAPGQVQEFVATVTGAVDAGVTWSASGGVLVPSGNSVSYTAPTVVGEFVLTATSVADAGREGTASISVAAVDPFWALQWGTGAWDDISGIVVDGADNVIIGGATAGHLFGQNRGLSDAFVAKLAPDGSRVWAYQHGTSSSDSVQSVAIDAADEVLIAGYTRGSLFGPHQGFDDAFIAKLAADGSLVWARQYGTHGLDCINAVFVDSADNVIIAGHTGGSLFGPNQGGLDAFAAKLTPDGSQVWAVQYGTVLHDGIDAAAVDRADNVIIAGSADGSLFGVNQGDNDAIVAKLSPDGSPVWAYQHGTTQVDLITALAVDGVDNVIIGGRTQGSLFGPNQGGFEDAFVAKLAPDGSTLWAHQYGTSKWDTIASVTVDSSNHVLIAGHTGGSLFGPHRGHFDAFVAKLAPDGWQVWARQHGTSTSDGCAAVDVDGSDHILIAGRTEGSLFGPLEGSVDVFVAKLAP